MRRFMGIPSCASTLDKDTPSSGTRDRMPAEDAQMPKKKIGFDTVRRMGLALPDVEEGKAYGSPALKVGGKMFACMAVHRSAEPGTLAVRVQFEHRDELIDADPKTYYLTDHYVNY